MTHICLGNLVIIGSDNVLSPGRRQAIIWTNAGILLIGPLGTNFSEILIEIHTFSFKKMHFKMSSGKWRPFWLGLNVLYWNTPPQPASIAFNPHNWMEIEDQASNSWSQLYHQHGINGKMWLPPKRCVRTESHFYLRTVYAVRWTAICWPCKHGYWRNYWQFMIAEVK